MNKNFVEKFSTVENILFLIFLFAFPTAFYLYNYSACAALGLEREAFYFCLELVVLSAYSLSSSAAFRTILCGRCSPKIYSLYSA